MDTSLLTNPTVRAAITALQAGDAAAWQKLFVDDAVMTDDGKPRSLVDFTHQAIGKEKFITIDRIDQGGKRLVGDFDAGQWGVFKVFFDFRLDENGAILQLDIGQA